VEENVRYGIAAKIATIFAILACAACSGLEAADGGRSIAFEDLAQQAGIADVGVNSTGPTFVDYDRDGDLDIYVPTEAHAPGHGNRLWENDGTGKFSNVGVERGVDNGMGLGRGASWGDFDNDGDADLAISNMPPTDRRQHVPTSLYRNLLVETGKPDFENVTRTAGLMRDGNENDAVIGGVGNTGGGVAWGDYDEDGYLDLYWKCADYDVDNALFRNLGDGTFTDVTAETSAGVLDKVREGNSQGSPNWTDFDQDGHTDLLVTNEGDAKVLLHNQGDGTFDNVTVSRRPPSGLAFLNPGNANGACIGDIDNDGDMDFFLPTADQANRLIVSELAETGSATFTDITHTSGVGDMDGARGCAMADFDNDGLLDIYVNNGGPSDVLINDVIDMPVFVQFYIAWEPAGNRLYRNNGDRTFTDVVAGSGAESVGVGSGVGAADLNDDGYPDLVVTNRTYYSMGKLVSAKDRTRLLLNRGGRNNWLRIALEGRRSNRDGYGARVKIVAGDLVQYREHTSAHGYNSGNDPRLLIGLGEEETVDLIEVTWSSGLVQSTRHVSANQTLEIVEKVPLEP
jgi:hypothetical protein